MIDQPITHNFQDNPLHHDSACTASESKTSEGPCTKMQPDPAVREWIRDVSLGILRKLDPLLPPLEDELKPYQGRSLWEATLEEVVLGVQESVVAAIPGLVLQGFRVGLDRTFPSYLAPPESS